MHELGTYASVRSGDEYDDVTTQLIADRADIGTGTLFLYAKTKGELLLLVQNSHYADALIEGRTAAAKTADTVEAVMAIVRPVVECNRVHVENGRTYLREMIFGDPAEPQHRAALNLTMQTEEAIADVLHKDKELANRSARLARAISGAMFVTLAAGTSTHLSQDEILSEIETLVRAMTNRT